MVTFLAIIKYIPTYLGKWKRMLCFLGISYKKIGPLFISTSGHTAHGEIQSDHLLVFTNISTGQCDQMLE